MSTVWATKYRLLLEQVECLVDWLHADKPREPRAVEEQAVRLLMSVAGLLRQHQVNKWGRCRCCAWTRRGLFWYRRPRCAVYRALDFAMGQPLDVVWWQLFEIAGRDLALAEVRKWLEQREHAAREVGGSEVAGDNTVVLERMSE